MEEDWTLSPRLAGDKKKTAHQKLANRRSMASRPLKIPEKQAEARLILLSYMI